MIDRYTTEAMGKIWSDYNKYSTWLKVELAVTEVLCEDKIVPYEDLEIIKNKAQFSVDRILGEQSTFQLGLWVREYSRWFVWAFVNYYKFKIFEFVDKNSQDN